MKRIVLLGFVLAACVPPSPSSSPETERRLARLEEDVRDLREENIALRQRLIELETVREAVPITSPVATKAIGARCRKAGNRYTLTRGETDEVLENTAGLATEMRIVPSFENGVARGFKLFAIKQGSFMASCGFENGDVITTVNGMDISSPDKALQVYSKIKDADQLVFAIERKGAKSTVVIGSR